MPRAKISKHDKYIRELGGRIKHRYDFLIYNVPISTEKRSLGEIDIIGRKGDFYDLYEVKCSHRIIKAKKQLRRAKRFLNMGNVRAYFYCGSSKKLVSM